MTTLVIVLLVAALIVLGTLVMLSGGKNVELECSLKTTKQALRAAQWLAGYNAAYLSAVQDYAMHRDNIGARGLWIRVQPMVSQVLRSNLNCYLPIERAPQGIREDARVYNAMVMANWPALYREPLTQAETTDQQRLRLLESVVLMQTSRLDRYTRALTKKLPALTEYSIQTVLEELSIELKADTDKMLGIVDPEEILPSIY